MRSQLIVHHGESSKGISIKIILIIPQSFPYQMKSICNPFLSDKGNIPYNGGFNSDHLCENREYGSEPTSDPNVE